MPSQSWKNLERHVAKTLEGFRIPRGDNFSRSFPDVVASSKKIASTNGIILAECKYSIRNPWVKSIRDVYNGQVLKVSNQNTDLLLFDINDIGLLSRQSYVRHTKIIPKYILEHLDQSRGYIDLINTNPLDRTILQAKTGLVFSNVVLPIVVLGQKNCSFRLAYTGLSDISSFLYNASKSQGCL